MQWASMLFLIGILLLWTTSTASPSNVSPRELKVLKAALKKQQRLKEQQQRSNKGVAASMGGSGEYVPDVGPWSSSDANEPTCEQLREMWRQSKRHSRAAEASNEIPQYADPFARATALYGRQLAAEPTMRPRSERRPVVYGRLHSSPSVDFESSDRTPRPFDVLRKISRTETEGLSGGPGGQSGGSSTSGVVLYGEKDRSPFAESSIKGSLQHLRDLVRDEQAGSGVKGSFQQLRNIVREENRDRPSSLPSRSDWSDADIGRVVTSPSDHGSSASKYSLFAMQGDAPYESPSLSQPSSEQHHHYNARRPAAAAFNYNHHNNRMPIKSQQHRNHNHNSNRQQPSVNEQLEAASRKPFQLRDPPRARMGSTSNRLATATASSRIGATGSNSNRWSDSEDVGVIRGYMQPAGRSNNNPLFSSKPTRRSSTLAADADTNCQTVDEFCRRHSDCQCSTGQQRCQRGRCVPVGKSNKNGAKRQKKRQQQPIADRDEEETERDETREGLLNSDQEQSDDELPTMDESSSSDARPEDILDIIDALQQIDPEFMD